MYLSIHLSLSISTRLASKRGRMESAARCLPNEFPVRKFQDKGDPTGLLAVSEIPCPPRTGGDFPFERRLLVKICTNFGQRGEYFCNDFHWLTLFQDRPRISAGTRWSGHESTTAGPNGRSRRPRKM